MRKISVAVIVIAIAALSFWAGGRYGNRQPSCPGVQQGERKVLYYVDPMNPGFRSDKPGIAPCGMPLEPVYADAAEGRKDSETSVPPGTVRISPARQQLIGVKVTTALVEPMTYTLRLYGKVVPDERRVYRINAATDSWIKELSDVTTGSIVRKNQVLAEALAPAYYNAQVTYLIALDNMDRIKQQMGGQLRHQQGDLANNQIRVSVQALQNLGISDAQVEELANTRQARPYLEVRAPSRGVLLSRRVSLNQWFKAAEEFYTIADIEKVWVYADVYENEARYLRPGMAVKVTHAQLGEKFSAKVSEVLPLFDPVSKTLKVRLDVDNRRYDLRPDMFVDVEIPITMPPSLNVPADAVIDSGTRNVVYVDMGDGEFEPREVETGWRLGRQVEVTGGLMPGEKIVISGNFLIDSESRMRLASAGDYGKTVKDPVCGMHIEEEKAERAGRTIESGGKTYYFCSQRCMRSFRKEPGKYGGKEKPVMTEHDHDMQVSEHSGANAVKPMKGNRNMWPTAKKPDLPKDSLGESSTSRTVIDWDGPETAEKDAARDWGSWGRFPGAEYLGLKHKTKSKSGQQQEKSRTSVETTAEGKRDSSAMIPASDGQGPERKNEIQEQPGSTQSEPMSK